MQDQEQKPKTSVELEHPLDRPLGDSRRWVFPPMYSGTGEGGMTKREFYAAMAMAGLMDPVEGLPADQCATLAVSHADALIAALGNG